MTTGGDDSGFHVLVSDSASGYAWRTAATLSEPGFDTDEWIGQACLTASGKRAVVVYAPRQFTNLGAVFDSGAFVATVDLASGKVVKLPFTGSLAYYDPGCGTGELAAVSSSATVRGRTVTTVRVIDAATGRVVRRTDTVGQLTSAVPSGGGVLAADGRALVSIDASGKEHRLAVGSAVPYRLHPDSSGGLAYQVTVGRRTEIRRFAQGRSTLLGHGTTGRVQVDASAGHVFLTGPDAARIPSSAVSAGAWRVLNVPVDSELSTTGELAVTASTNHVNTPGARPTDIPTRIAVQAVVTGTRKTASFTVDPAAIDPAAGKRSSPALAMFGAAGALSGTGASGATSGHQHGVSPNATTLGGSSTDPSTVPWDPDRGCAVPRNDPTIQTYQPTAAQVEWAADLAVLGQLTRTRGVNWQNSGMPVSWTPQDMFPLQQINGGGTLPAQVLLGVLAQESNTMQASPHAVDAVNGNANQGGFYGDGIDWGTVDCGYGIGQITSGMAMSTSAGTSVADGNIAKYTTAQMQQAIATDYASNIAATANMLIDKWNQLKTAGIIAGNGDPTKVENWWFAVWAYNSGVQPGSAAYGNTTGCTPSPSCTDNGGAGGNWGLGWLNNPANPAYPADRGVFTNNAADTKVPNHWTYPEKIMGWAYSPVARYNYATKVWGPAFAAANGGGKPLEPGFMQFCTTDDGCTPNAATDANGTANAAGLCNVAQSHCWWHVPSMWVDCNVNACGTANVTYTSSSSVPLGTTVYPSDCRSPGTASGSSSSDSLGPTPPSGAVIVGNTNVPGTTCNMTGYESGQFSLKFPYASPYCNPGCTAPIDYPGKIDFHQLGVGYGGHLWFTHTVPASDTAHTITGTWTPPALSGWYRIQVHIPDSGDTTQQADYQINLGNGTVNHRVVNTRWSKNTWVDLGAFQLTGQPSVSLSNVTNDGNGADIAWDAVAFSPTVQPSVNYVALGDSYSAGEGQDPYDPNSDYVGGDGTKHACHRSVSNAYGRQVTLPGHTKPIAQEAAAVGNTESFAFLACSGALTTTMTTGALDNPATADDTAGSTVWGTSKGGWGEVQELQQGYLDSTTTLVTLSIGGNDSRFAAIMKGCIATTIVCTGQNYYLTVGHTVDPQPLINYEPYVIQTLLPSHLKTVYDTIHGLAPNAKIVVVGYPHLFAPNASGGCGTDMNDQLWLNQMTDDLDNAIQSVVGQEAMGGVDIGFVDPRPAWDGTGGHWSCQAGGTPWVNGVVASSSSGSGTDTPGTGSFHPTAAGQAEYAQLVNTYLATH